MRYANLDMRYAKCSAVICSLRSGLPRVTALLLTIFLYTCVRAQSLDSLRADLRRENPELRALDLDFEAAMRVGGQLDQLPDLEIGGGVFVLPVETRTGPQQFRVGATQMLPWPGKLAALAEVADARARPLLQRAAARQLMLLYELEAAYFTMAGLDARGEVLRESLALYESLNELALSRVENGKGSSVDVYRVQLQWQRVERRLTELRYLGRQEAVKINALLDRPADTPVYAPVDIDRRVRETLDFAPDLAADDPDLSRHPGLLIYREQQAVSELAIDLTDLDRRPDFGVGVDYITVGRRDDAEPPRNGRDVILPRAMIKLPLGKAKFSGKREEEEVRIRALDARREATENEFRAELRRALNAIDNAANELYFLREQARVLEATLAIARSEYANGQRAFDELLRLENELVDLRIRAVTARTTILLQRAVIDRYLIPN